MPLNTGEVLLLAPVLLAACTIQVFTGFGSALVAITIAANFMPVERLVPTLVPLSILVTGSVAVRHRGHVETRLVLRQILPCMGGGLALGLFAWHAGLRSAPAWILGVIVLVFSSRELWFHFRGDAADGRSMPAAAAGFFQVLAGVTHAFYAAGGPFLTYSLGRQNLSKGAFRATLSVIWTVMNVVMTAALAAGGRISADTLATTLPLLPVLPVGFAVGEALHRRVSEHRFRLFVWALLFCSGVPLVLR